MKWYNNSIFYHIYPLGFCGAPEANDLMAEPVERLYKIAQWLPHIKSLGVNAIYLGPLFESGSHGYDTVDYLNVDRRLGINSTLKRVIEEAHNLGIKVVLDGVFNHVSREFFAFKDLIANKEKSVYKDWFKNVDFTNTSPMGDNFSYECWEGHFQLPSLNLKNEFVENHIFNAVTMWVNDFDIDGLRLDVAEVLDFGFLSDLSEFCKTVKNDFWLLGEVIHGDYRDWANPAMLDSTTNYECYKGMYSSFNDGNMYEIAYSLRRLFDSDSGIYKGLTLYNFADNHDVDRVVSILKDRGDLFPLHILLFTIPGIPSIYYGSEWTIEGVKEEHSDRLVRPAIDLGYMEKNYPWDLIDVIKRLAAIRMECKSLQVGGYRELLVDSRQLLFERTYKNERVIVAINSSESEIKVKIPIKDGEVVMDVLNNREFPVIGSTVELELYGKWGGIFYIK